MSGIATGVKRGLIGRPLASEEEHTQRLSKKIALAVFSSDAISSNAYATEEILLVLVVVGISGLSLAVPIALAIAGLLAIVAMSYQQTVRAYPNGGGSYIVGSENLGMYAGLVAASALLFDYVLTVAVSVASGVAAITSAFPMLYTHRVVLATSLVALIAFANLRGLKESGRLFALPTYSFIVLCGGLILVGLVRAATGTLPSMTGPAASETTQTLGIVLVLQAFAGGCVAMTGTEAISNGVPVFKKPESRNASMSLGIMALILGSFMIGITVLANALQVVPQPGDTVVSQIARVVYGQNTTLYFALQLATMAILVVAANTSFADFPRLSSILARDGFLPRQLMNRGDRLVFSNGVIGLALVSILLLIAFDARTHALIPLYAVGVFTSFTISQAGMVKHWHKLRTEVQGWRRRAMMNGFGATATAIVAGVVLTAKFIHGAYVVLIAMALMIALFSAIHRHYARVTEVLQPQQGRQLERIRLVLKKKPRTTVVLFIAQVNEVVAHSLYLAKAMGENATRAATVKIEETAFSRLQEQWSALGTGIPLEVIESPYREFTRPAVSYVRSLNPGPDHMVVVVVPEFVVEHWWQALLHNQNALRLKGALFLVPWVAVMSIPFHLRGAAEEMFPDEAAGRLETGPPIKATQETREKAGT